MIEPHCPTGRRGRPPIGIERMLRIYLALRESAWLQIEPSEEEKDAGAVMLEVSEASRVGL